MAVEERSIAEKPGGQGERGSWADPLYPAPCKRETSPRTAARRPPWTREEDAGEVGVFTSEASYQSP